MNKASAAKFENGYDNLVMETKRQSVEVPLSEIADRIPEFYVLSIDAIANKLIKDGGDIIKLNLGKSELPMPKYVADEMVDTIYDEVKREAIDPQGLILLREEITKDYKINNDVEIFPEQVFE